MKKSRIMVFGLIVAVMLMGAGYAYWNDTLKINNTVSTGTLDVDFGSTGNVEFQASNANGGNPVATGTATGSENTATVTLTNLYPGAEATVTIDVTNNGSIPVKNGDFAFTGQPTWLIVTPVDQAAVLAVDQTKTIKFTVKVDENITGVDQQGLENVTFTGTAIYDQFNK